MRSFPSSRFGEFGRFGRSAAAILLIAGGDRFILDTYRDPGLYAWLLLGHTLASRRAAGPP